MIPIYYISEKPKIQPKNTSLYVCTKTAMHICVLFNKLFLHKNKTASQKETVCFPIFSSNLISIYVLTTESHEEILDVISVYHRLR